MTTKKTTSFEGRRFSGVLLARKYGTNDPFQELGNCNSMQITSEIERDELLSTGWEDYGQVISSYITTKSVQISMTFDSFEPKSLARALMGEVVESEEAAAPFNVSITASAGFHELGVKNIDLKSVKVNGESEGFRVMPMAGLIEFDLTKFTEGDVLAVSGTTEKADKFSIAGYTQQQIVLELKLDGRDLISQRRGLLEIPHAVLGSNANVDWFAKSWWENGLEGNLIKDKNKETFIFSEWLPTD